jgi:hypothetical protein
MVNLLIVFMQKVLNNLRNLSLDGIIKQKLMIVMVHNYMKVKNA